MADNQNPDIDFVEDAEIEETSPEYVIVNDEDAPEQPATPEAPEDDKVVLSRADLAALTQRDDSGMREALAGLTDVLRANRQPVNGNEVPESEFWQEVSSDMIDPDKAKDAFTKAFSRVGGPILNQTLRELQDAKRELLKQHPVNGPLYTRFEKEIDRKVRSLDISQQNNPGVYQWAFEQVRNEHASELEEERVTAKAEEIVNKRLEELGITPQTQGVTQSQGPSRQRRAAMPALNTFGGAGLAPASANTVRLNKEEQVQYNQSSQRGLSQGAILAGLGKIK